MDRLIPAALLSLALCVRPCPGQQDPAPAYPNAAPMPSWWRGRGDERQQDGGEQPQREADREQEPGQQRESLRPGRRAGRLVRDRHRLRHRFRQVQLDRPHRPAHRTSPRAAFQT